MYLYVCYLYVVVCFGTATGCVTKHQFFAGNNLLELLHRESSFFLFLIIMALTVVVASEGFAAKVLNSLMWTLSFKWSQLIHLYCKDNTAYSSFKASIFIRL